MGRACTICTLRRRRELEREYTAGVAVSELAERYNVGRDAVRRHLDQHYMEPVDNPVDPTTEMQGLGVLEEQLLRDLSRLRELSERATKEGDLRLAGDLLQKVIGGHGQLIASRDRRIGHHARLLARAMEEMSPTDRRATVASMMEGAVMSGEFTVATPPPQPENKEAPSPPRTLEETLALRRAMMG